MQLDGLVWLAAGTGIGLTLAMFILAGVLVVDGMKLRRRMRSAKALMATAEPASRPVRRPPPPPPVVTAPPPKRPEPKRPEPKPIAPPKEEPVVIEVESAPVIELAAAIAQARVVAEPVEAKVASVAEPVPEIKPPPVIELPAPVEVAPAVPAEEPVVAEAAPPKRAPKAAPPLPKVTPARKFAPALPPKDATSKPADEI